MAVTPGSNGDHGIPETVPLEHPLMMTLSILWEAFQCVTQSSLDEVQELIRTVAEAVHDSCALCTPAFSMSEDTGMCLNNQLQSLLVQSWHWQNT